MRTVNRIFLVGRLGTDPEVRLTADGQTITRLRLATHRSVRQGESWSQATDWHKLVVFDHQAKLCGDRLRKGESIAVVGDLRYSHWIDANGMKRVSPEIVAREVSFLGSSIENRAAPTMEVPAEPSVPVMESAQVPEAK